MPKKKSESVRKHEVRAQLNNFELAKAKSALTLRIYEAGEKVGELQVGRGSLYWWGRRRHKHKRLNWVKFTRMMNLLAYGEEDGS
jgi:hypothetical protein